MATRSDSLLSTLHELPHISGFRNISDQFDIEYSDYKKSIVIIGWFIASIYICLIMTVFLLLLVVRYGDDDDTTNITKRRKPLIILSTCAVIITVVLLMDEAFIHQEILRISTLYAPEPAFEYCRHSVDRILINTGGPEARSLHALLNDLVPYEGPNYFGDYNVEYIGHYAENLYTIYKLVKDMIPTEWVTADNKDLEDSEFTRHCLCLLGWFILMLAAVMFLIGIALGSELAVVLLVVFGVLDFLIMISIALALTFGVAVATADACANPGHAAKQIVPLSLQQKYIFYQALACAALGLTYAVMLLIYIKTIRWTFATLVVREDPDKRKKKIRKQKKSKKKIEEVSRPHQRKELNIYKGEEKFKGKIIEPTDVKNGKTHKEKGNIIKSKENQDIKKLNKINFGKQWSDLAKGTKYKVEKDKGDSSKESNLKDKLPKKRKTPTMTNNVEVAHTKVKEKPNAGGDNKPLKKLAKSEENDKSQQPKKKLKGSKELFEDDKKSKVKQQKTGEIIEKITKVSANKFDRKLTKKLDKKKATGKEILLDQETRISSSKSFGELKKSQKDSKLSIRMENEKTKTTFSKNITDQSNNLKTEATAQEVFAVSKKISHKVLKHQKVKQVSADEKTSQEIKKPTNKKHESIRNIEETMKDPGRDFDSSSTENKKHKSKKITALPEESKIQDTTTPSVKSSDESRKSLKKKSIINSTKQDDKEKADVHEREKQEERSDLPLKPMESVKSLKQSKRSIDLENEKRTPKLTAEKLLKNLTDRPGKESEEALTVSKKVSDTISKHEQLKTALVKEYTSKDNLKSQFEDKSKSHKTEPKLQENEANNHDFKKSKEKEGKHIKTKSTTIAFNQPDGESKLERNTKTEKNDVELKDSKSSKFELKSRSIVSKEFENDNIMEINKINGVMVEKSSKSKEFIEKKFSTETKEKTKKKLKQSDTSSELEVSTNKSSKTKIAQKPIETLKSPQFHSISTSNIGKSNIISTNSSKKKRRCFLFRKKSLRNKPEHTENKKLNAKIQKKLGKKEKAKTIAEKKSHDNSFKLSKPQKQSTNETIVGSDETNSQLHQTNKKAKPLKSRETTIQQKKNMIKLKDFPKSAYSQRVNKPENDQKKCKKLAKKEKESKKPKEFEKSLYKSGTSISKFHKSSAPKQKNPKTQSIKFGKISNSSSKSWNNSKRLKLYNKKKSKPSLLKQKVNKEKQEPSKEDNLSTKDKIPLVKTEKVTTKDKIPNPSEKRKTSTNDDKLNQSKKEELIRTDEINTNENKYKGQDERIKQSIDISKISDDESEEIVENRIKEPVTEDAVLKKSILLEEELLPKNIIDGPRVICEPSCEPCKKGTIKKNSSQFNKAPKSSFVELMRKSKTYRPFKNLKQAEYDFWDPYLAMESNLQASSSRQRSFSDDSESTSSEGSKWFMDEHFSKSSKQKTLRDVIRFENEQETLPSSLIGIRSRFIDKQSSNVIEPTGRSTYGSMIVRPSSRGESYYRGLSQSSTISMKRPSLKSNTGKIARMRSRSMMLGARYRNNDSFYREDYEFSRVNDRSFNERFKYGRPNRISGSIETGRGGEFKYGKNMMESRSRDYYGEPSLKKQYKSGMSYMRGAPASIKTVRGGKMKYSQSMKGASRKPSKYTTIEKSSKIRYGQIMGTRSKYDKLSAGRKFKFGKIIVGKTRLIPKKSLKAIQYKTIPAPHSRFGSYQGGRLRFVKSSIERPRTIQKMSTRNKSGYKKMLTALNSRYPDSSMSRTRKSSKLEQSKYEKFKMGPKEKIGIEKPYSMKTSSYRKSRPRAKTFKLVGKVQSNQNAVRSDLRYKNKSIQRPQKKGKTSAGLYERPLSTKIRGGAGIGKRKQRNLNIHNITYTKSLNLKHKRPLKNKLKDERKKTRSVKSSQGLSKRKKEKSTGKLEIRNMKKKGTSNYRGERQTTSVKKRKLKAMPSSTKSPKSSNMSSINRQKKVISRTNSKKQPETVIRKTKRKSSNKKSSVKSKLTSDISKGSKNKQKQKNKSGKYKKGATKGKKLTESKKKVKRGKKTGEKMLEIQRSMFLDEKPSETERIEKEEAEKIKQGATRLAQGKLPCNKYECDSTIPICSCSCLEMENLKPSQN